jgi:hypothetical protein
VMVPVPGTDSANLSGPSASLGWGRFLDGGLAHALAPIDRQHDSLQRPDSPAGFLESGRGCLLRLLRDRYPIVRTAIQITWRGGGREAAQNDFTGPTVQPQSADPSADRLDAPMRGASDGCGNDHGAGDDRSRNVHASVPRIPRADGAGVRVHVAGGAIVVALGAVRVGGDVGRDIGAAARDVALDGVAVLERAKEVIADLEAKKATLHQEQKRKERITA